MALLATITKDLPSNPTEAIAVIADRIDKQVIQPSNHVGTPADYRAIAKFIVRFCARFDVAVDFSDISVGNRNLDDESEALAYLEEHLEKLKDIQLSVEEQRAESEVESLISQYETVATSEKFGLAKLNEDEKKKIHSHLTKIRKVIGESDLSDRKKNALFDRLNALAKEVDAHGTHTDRFFAFAGDVGFVLGDMAKKAKPLLHEVKEVLRIVSRSRAREEGISLPPGDEVLQLAPPNEEVE